MSDRLPDEAVEAMARALCDLSNRREQENYDRGMNGDARPCFLSYDEWREEFDENASAALAALPAGVYHSDGEGNVTPDTEPRNVLPQVDLLMAELERANNDLGSYGTGYEQALVDLGEQLRLRFGFAALSATDTEKAGE